MIKKNNKQTKQSQAHIHTHTVHKHTKHTQTNGKTTENEIQMKDTFFLSSFLSFVVVVVVVVAFVSWRKKIFETATTKSSKHLQVKNKNRTKKNSKPNYKTPYLPPRPVWGGKAINNKRKKRKRTFLHTTIHTHTNTHADTHTQILTQLQQNGNIW